MDEENNFKEYLQFARKHKGFKSWFSKISMEAVENEIKEYLELAKEFLDNFSDSIKSCWFVKAKIPIEEFVQNKTREFLNLARCFFDNLSNIIKQRLVFSKVKQLDFIDGFVQKNMTNEYLNLARRFFESFSDSFKQKFDEIKVSIEELVQKKLGGSSNNTCSSVKTCLAVVQFFLYFREFLNKDHMVESDNYDVKQVIICLCEYLLLNMGYGDSNSMGIIYRLVIWAVKYCVKKKLYMKGSEEFDDTDKQESLGDFLQYMTGIGILSGVILCLVMKAIK